MRCLNLRPWEAAAMAAGRVREIWRPMKPQPVVPDGATGPHVNGLGCWYWLVYPGTPMQFACSDRLPVLCGNKDNFSRQFVKPGTVLTCREAWAAIWPAKWPDGIVFEGDEWSEHGRPIRLDECSIVFRADTPNDKYPGGWEDGDDPECPRWEPAQRMPANLARFRPVVATCEPRRVESITGAEDFQTGVKVCEENGHDDCFYGTQGYRCAFLRQWQDAYPGAAWAWRVVLEATR